MGDAGGGRKPADSAWSLRCAAGIEDHVGPGIAQVRLNGAAEEDVYDVGDLASFVRWLFGETARQPAEYAHECMALFTALVPVVGGP